MKLASIVINVLVVGSLVAVATGLAVPMQPSEEPVEDPANEPAGEPVSDPMGDPTEARPETGLTPQEKARQERFVKRFRQAQRLMGSGKDAESETMLRELVAEEPGAAAVHHALAIVLRYQKQADAATASFREAARLAPGDPVIQRDTGLDLMGRGRPVDAEPYLASAHRLWPQDLESVIGHGAALRALGREAEAEKAYRAAVAQEPGSVDALAGLGACLVRRDPEEALRVVEKIPPHFPDVSLVAGLALEKLERYDEAVEKLLNTSRRSPPGAAGLAFHRQCTEALVRCGRAEAAGEAAGRWFEAENSSGRTSLGSAFAVAVTRVAVGESDAALNGLDKALVGRKLPPEVFRHLSLFRAAVLVESGSLDKARKALEMLASAESDAFEHLAARRILGTLGADEFAAGGHGDNRANDVAWVESLAARLSGDAAAATAHRADAAAKSVPPGEFPGLLVRPAPSSGTATEPPSQDKK